MEDMKRQDGFGAVGILVVVVALVVIGGAGWLVYNKSQNSKPRSTTSTADVSSQQPSTASAEDTDLTLKIPELGIKLVSTEELGKLVYAKTADGTVGLSTQALVDFDAGCAPEKGNVGVIVTFKDPNGTDKASFSGTNIETYPNAAKVGDTYYAPYFASLFQAPCAANVGTGQTETARDKEYTAIQLKPRTYYKEIKVEKL